MTKEEALDELRNALIHIDDAVTILNSVQEECEDDELASDIAFYVGDAEDLYRSIDRTVDKAIIGKV